MLFVKKGGRDIWAVAITPRKKSKMVKMYVFIIFKLKKSIDRVLLLL